MKAGSCNQYKIIKSDSSVLCLLSKNLLWENCNLLLMPLEGNHSTGEVARKCSVASRAMKLSCFLVPWELHCTSFSSLVLCRCLLAGRTEECNACNNDVRAALPHELVLICSLSARYLMF